MATLHQGMLDKKIIETIRAFPPDKFGSAYFDAAVSEFVRVSLQLPEVVQAAAVAGLTEADLCHFYKEMVKHLMPNPYILAGGRMVAASLPFYEPFRLRASANAIRSDLLDEAEDTTRAEIISWHAQVVAQATWDAHTAKRGEATIPTALNEASLARQGCGAGAALVVIALYFIATSM